MTNYSESQEQEMAFVYDSSDTDSERAEDVNQLAQKFGKSVQSIRAKLSKLGVYIKPAKLAKNGKAVIRKSDMVLTLAEHLGIMPEDVASAEKATVTVLESINAQFDFLESKVKELQK